MLNADQKHEFIMLANANLFDLRPEFESYIADTSRRVHYCQWLSPGPLAARWPANQSRRTLAQHLREFAIRRLQPDVIFISSLFEGFCDECVLSIDTTPGAAPTVAIHYDLIPLIQAKTYLLPQPDFEIFYKKQLTELSQATQLLAISEYAAQEAIEWLDLPADQITTISSACDTDLFCPAMANRPDREPLPEELIKGFIFYSGAADTRKNLKRLIQAYAALPAPIRGRHQLALVGKLCDAEVMELKGWMLDLGLKPDRVVLLGYVDDPTLARLYRQCTVFIFPSLHEGFGLPALEAMSCGAAVIGSNRTSIPEVIGDPEAMFDPTDVVAMSNLLHRSLTDSAFYQRLLANAQERSQLFSWFSSAAKALSAIEKLLVGPEFAVKQAALEWNQIVAQREDLYATLLQQIVDELALTEPWAVKQIHLQNTAIAIAFCERETNAIGRCSIDQHNSLSWRLEGPSTHDIAWRSSIDT